MLREPTPEELRWELFLRERDEGKLFLRLSDQKIVSLKDAYTYSVRQKIEEASIDKSTEMNGDA